MLWHAKKPRVTHCYPLINFNSSFVREINRNFQYYIIVTYVWSRLTMLSSMITLLFVLVEHNTIPVELVRATIMIGWTFFSMFCICNLGQMITNQFERFDFALGQCNWYTLPLKIQRMSLIFSSNAQQLTVIQGYDYKWTRNTFKMVIVSQLTSMIDETFEFDILFFTQFQTIRTSYCYFILIHRIGVNVFTDG